MLNLKIVTPQYPLVKFRQSGMFNWVNSSVRMESVLVVKEGGQARHYTVFSE